ncbi:MAG: LCP family protein [Acidimicrobiales bacterium]
MSSSGTVVVRRTWPQRLVILCSLGIIAAAIGASWFLNDVYESFTDLGRVEFAADVLITDTDPGEPVNFLLIGEDSAEGLDPDDPAGFAREVDPRGFQADSITILRVNPTTGQAWVLSLPRDLLVDVRGTERKINSLLLVEGHELLVETITANFGITINHFMSLDFLGFREVVDELGGIPVWFAHPARDYKPSTGENPSGLNITTAGCHVLDGEQSLQYVRSRFYQELIDGDWTTVGNSDFGRVERQQDFLVLALERAIDRGARNPTQLASLIAAGASSLVLDAELTVAELIDVGEAFSNFNPENLDRYSIEVSTIFDGSTYVGERAIEGRNDEIFAIFRGDADLRSASDVAFELYGTDQSETERIAVELGAQGFTIGRTFTVDRAETGNVVVYPTGERAAAETVARYLLPIPRLVEDPGAAGLSVVLGTEHEQVLIFYPHDVPTMRAAVAAQGDGPVPSLDGATEIGTTSTSGTLPTTTSAPESTTTTSTPESTTTTTTIPTDEPAAPTTTGGIIGRPPEGQSCS